MSRVQSRREFIREALIAGTAVPAAGLSFGLEPTPAPLKSANERLNIGVIGVAARGAANLMGVSSENIAVLCDIDRERLAAAKKFYPDAVAYEDFRRVLDHRELDAIVVSTPDHMHAIPALWALREGFDVYCEKPLAHSVHEVRALRDASKRYACVTQMGTQIHAGDNYRRAVEIVRSGILGPIRRVHVWMGTNKPIPGSRVEEAVPPGHVNYDLWLGPAPYRPFHASHFHFNWRYWWDFGGGVLADFGCHFMDLPHWALRLKDAVLVEAKGEKNYEGDNQVPDQLRVDYHYPARGDLPPVHLTWYHGSWRPEGAEQYEKGAAVLFEGERGRLLSDYTTRKLYLKEEFQDLAKDIPGVNSIPNSIGHHKEWIEAVKTRGPTTCNFEYSGALAETALLGNVSYRAGQTKLEWDARSLRVKNDVPEAAQYIRREYRKGWSLEGRWA